MITPDQDVNRALQAFRHDRRSRQLLRDIVLGRREFVATELLVATVLDHLKEDRRSWIDWRETVLEAAARVLKEQRKGRAA